MACLGMFGLSWLVGYSICRAILGSVWRSMPMTLRLGLGSAAGSAFSGMTTFWAIVLAPYHRGVVVGIAEAVGLSLFLTPWARRSVDLPDPSVPAGRWQRLAWWAGSSVFSIVLLMWVARGLHTGAGSPAGGWDAFSIWTQRARFFYLCPEEWTRAFDPAMEWSHPEYPNLLPGLIAYGWLPEGRCLALSPVAVAVMTQVAKLLLIVGLTQAAYPSTVWAWVFGIYYATIPQEWTQEEAWQYADRPLAVFLLGGIGCLALARRQPRQSWFFLAGLFWGAAGFCKDEGKAALVILGIGALLAIVCSLCHGGGWRAVGNLGLLALGLAPGIGSLALQWAYSPVPTKLIELMTIDPLRDTGRTSVILHYLLNRLDHPQWGGMWWGCGLALATLAPWLRRCELWLLVVFPMIQLSVYLLIFQLTPQPLAWHLESALPRLLFHISPIIFLAASWLILEAKEATSGADAVRQDPGTTSRGLGGSS